MSKTSRRFEDLDLSVPFDATVFKMKSPTFGILTINDVCNRIVEFIGKEKALGHDKFTIAVGTDSQAFSSVKVVSVIAVHCEGNGGIYFYETFKFPQLSIHDKILNEAVLSLNLASTITPILEKSLDFKDGISFQIHCDIGEDGKTKKYINEITGMVKACDYDCVIKPDSFAASGIANKYSK